MKEQISVIGGGISGLAFSHYCSVNNHAVRIFDKQKQGGCVSSYVKGAYPAIEMGAHTLTNTYRHIIEIIRHYGAEECILPTERLKFSKYHGRLLPITRGLHWPELAQHLPNVLFRKKEGNSIKDYYSGILGRKNYNELFRYAFQAVLCQDPDNYPAELLFRKRKRDKQYPRTFTLKGGMEQLLKLIMTNPLLHCVPEGSVEEVTHADNLFQLRQETGGVFTSPFLCLACPPDAASAIIKNLDPVLAGKLARIRMVEVDSLLVSVPAKARPTKAPKNVIGIDQPFSSALGHKRGDEDCWLFHFKEKEYEEAEKLRIISKVIDMPVTSISVLKSRISRMPAPETRHLALLKEIDSHIGDRPLFISSNYMQGLALEDCCERAQKEAFRLESMLRNNSSLSRMPY